MLLDIIYTLVIFGAGSLQGWLMARRNMRKEIGSAIALAEEYNALSPASKDRLQRLIEQEAESDGQRT